MPPGASVTDVGATETAIRTPGVADAHERASRARKRLARSAEVSIEGSDLASSLPGGAQGPMCVLQGREISTSTGA